MYIFLLPLISFCSGNGSSTNAVDDDEDDNDDDDDYLVDLSLVQAENTYILVLDGDVEFKPDAVRLLLDRMKKNKKVGAACGRIHPIGSGQ